MEVFALVLGLVLLSQGFVLYQLERVRRAVVNQHKTQTLFDRRLMLLERMASR